MCWTADVQAEGMRKQYHFRPGAVGLDAWDVDRLIALVATAPVEAIALEDIAELDTDYWFDHGHDATVRRVAEHARLINDVDLSYPIVLDPDGRVMDGMHRVARALMEGRATVGARRVATLPPPDFTNCRPDDLPY